MLASAFRYNGGMKNAARRRIVAVLTAGILAFSAAPAWAKSAKEVFAEVAGSVVVVLALDSSGETQAQGSGVVVGQNEVATNCHVIDEAESVVVRQAADSGGGETYRMDARILARDDERDLCLLFVGELSDPPAAPVVEMGAAKGLSVGEEVFAVGAPEGLELSMSRGIVSQLRGVHGKRAAPLVQTDAAISPGSSGGGLFNENAELVGITTFKWKGESLNFAIPAEWIGELREKSREELAEEEKRRECVVNPDYECVIATALSIARSTDYASWALRGIVSAQMEAGDTDGAFASARSITPAYSRASILGDIALAQAEAGDAQSARDTFAAALSAVRSIDGVNIRAGALGDIASARAKAGDFDGAFATAQSINSAFHRALALRKIALAQAEVGDSQLAWDTFAAALSVAQSVDKAYDRDTALSGIARAQAKAGDFNGAFAIARSIGGADDRAEALRSIGLAQTEVGGIDNAFAAAQSIDEAYFRAGALRKIALAQMEAGDSQSARDTLAVALSAARNIDSIDDARMRADALRNIASAQAESGDMNGALYTARSIGDADGRAGALRGIALAQAESGDMNGALYTARSIGDAYDRTGALRGIVLAQAESGDIDGAFATARSIDNTPGRALALSDIASAQAEAGDGPSTRDTFAAAISAARSIEDAGFRAYALSDIASARAEAGYFRGAMKTAMEIEKDGNRARALANIAKHLAAREKE